MKEFPNSCCIAFSPSWITDNGRPSCRLQSVEEAELGIGDLLPPHPAHAYLHS